MGTQEEFDDSDPAWGGVARTLGLSLHPQLPGLPDSWPHFLAMVFPVSFSASTCKSSFSSPFLSFAIRDTKSNSCCFIGAGSLSKGYGLTGAKSEEKRKQMGAAVAKWRQQGEGADASAGSSGGRPNEDSERCQEEGTEGLRGAPKGRRVGVLLSPRPRCRRRRRRRRRRRSPS